MTPVTNESQFKKLLVRGLREQGFHVQEHEDYLSTGIPDLSWAKNGFDGWMELKWLPVHVQDKFNPGIDRRFMKQVSWLEQRGRVGAGCCHLLCGHKGGYILIEWSRIRDALRQKWDAIKLWEDFTTLPRHYVDRALRPLYGSVLQRT